MNDYYISRRRTQVTRTKTPSKLQERILRRMVQDGWTLRVFAWGEVRFVDPFHERETVSSQSFRAIRDAGWIELDASMPTTWRVSDAGRKAAVA